MSFVATCDSVQCNHLFTDLETTKAALQARYEDALKLTTAGNYRACHFLYRNMDDDKLERAKSTNVIAAERRPQLARPRQHDVLHTAVNRPAGVFFSADVWWNSGLPRPSAEQYGSNRLLLQADRLLTKSTNLYFVNYTKATQGKAGYVTLLAVDRSKAISAQEFAEEMFLRLKYSRQSPSGAAEAESHPNPFLYYDTATQTWQVTTDLHVEVFYAHDVSIDDLSLGKMNACLYRCNGNPNFGTVLRPRYVQNSTIRVDVDRWQL